MGKEQIKKVSVATRIWPSTKEHVEKMADKKGMSYTDYVDMILSLNIDEIKKEHEKEIENIKIKHEKEIARLNERIDRLLDTVDEAQKATTNAQNLHAEIKYEYNNYREQQEKEKQLLLESEEEKNRKWWKFWKN